MTLTRPSSTGSTTLQDVIGRLRQRDEVDGLMVIGSAARNELGPASDYDLVILMSKMPVPVEFGQTYIDGRLTDLKFFTAEDIDRLIAAEEPIDPYTAGGSAFLRMGDGKIEMDRSGRLKRAQRKVLAGMPLRLFTEQEKHSRWWMMNFFLRTAGRLIVSDDAAILHSADMKLNDILFDMMLDYFNFRDLLWKGEKDAIRYWTNHDPDYLDSFVECLEERDTRQKLRLCVELAEATAAPVGGIWGDGHTALNTRFGADSDISSETETALSFWEQLVAR